MPATSAAVVGAQEARQRPAVAVPGRREVELVDRVAQLRALLVARGIPDDDRPTHSSRAPATKSAAGDPPLHTERGSRVLADVAVDRDVAAAAPARAAPLPSRRVRGTDRCNREGRARRAGARARAASRRRRTGRGRDVGIMPRRVEAQGIRPAPRVAVHPAQVDRRDLAAAGAARRPVGRQGHARAGGDARDAPHRGREAQGLRQVGLRVPGRVGRAAAPRPAGCARRARAPTTARPRSSRCPQAAARARGCGSSFASSERPPGRAAHQRAEHVVVAAPARPRAITSSAYESRTAACAFITRARLADRERDEAVDLADLAADPAHCFALMARDLLGARAPSTASPNITHAASTSAIRPIASSRSTVVSSGIASTSRAISRVEVGQPRVERRACGATARPRVGAPPTPCRPG